MGMMISSSGRMELQATRLPKDELPAVGSEVTITTTPHHSLKSEDEEERKYVVLSVSDAAVLVAHDAETRRGLMWVLPRHCRRFRPVTIVD
jgi:hypothetical protein